MYLTSLAAATFDASGELIGAESTSIMPRYLDPDDSGPFRISLPSSGVGDSVDSYEIYVDAQVDDPYEPILISIGDIYEDGYAHDYLDYFGNLHLVTTLTNEGSVSYNVTLLAGIMMQMAM